MAENKPADRLDPVQVYRRRFVRRVWATVGALAFLLFVVIYWGIFPEVPTDYADIKDHFKYGSIGSDGEQGIPYWIWRVLPDMFPDHLPEPERFRSLPAGEQTHQAAYAQFGFLVEAGRDLP